MEETCRTLARFFHHRTLFCLLPFPPRLAEPNRLPRVPLRCRRFSPAKTPASFRWRGAYFPIVCSGSAAPLPRERPGPVTPDEIAETFDILERSRSGAPSRSSCLGRHTALVSSSFSAPFLCSRDRLQIDQDLFDSERLESWHFSPSRTPKGSTSPQTFMGAGPRWSALMGV